MPAAVNGEVAVLKAEKSPNHRVERPAVETVLQAETSEMPSAILLPRKGPDRLLFDLRQVNGGAGTARDQAGQAAVVHMKMGDQDPAAILHPPVDLGEAGLQRRQNPGQVGTGVDQRESVLFQKGKDVNMFQAKGHRKRDHVDPIRHLTDTCFQ